MKLSTQPSSNNPLGQRRVEWVDIAKGLCIILVVMMHTTLGLEKEVGETGWMHALVEFARPFRMPDFFMISGLFLAATIDRPWRLYLDRKVVHFFYFYILWVLIQFAFKAPFMIADGHSVPTVVRSLLFATVQPFGTLWFIYMLPIFFVVTKLFRSSPWPLFVAAAILQIMPVNTTSLMSGMADKIGVVGGDSHWVLVDEFASYYVYFLGGYLFAPHIFKLAAYTRLNLASALAGLTVWFSINLALVYFDLAATPIISLVLGAAGAVAITTMASLLTRVKLGDLLNHLGARSIVVYLAFFVPMVIARLAMIKLTPWIDVGTMAALGTAVAVISPLVGLAVIERINFGHFLFRRPAWAVLAVKPPPSRVSIQAAE